MNESMKKKLGRLNFNVLPKLSKKKVLPGLNLGKTMPGLKRDLGLGKGR